VCEVISGTVGARAAMGLEPTWSSGGRWLVRLSVFKEGRNSDTYVDRRHVP
jgi:hypothetical protein